MIGVGVVGYGYWGPNLVRNFFEDSDFEVFAVCDRQIDRLNKVQGRYPRIQVTGDYQDLLKNPAIDAIAIATPVSTHYELAMQAMQAGKHVFVEKPMAASAEQAERMLEESIRRNVVLMVDHTFVYTGAVRQIHQLLSSQAIGDVYYYDSVRVNLGLFQHDVDVIWDLAVHDLAILDHILPMKPCAVSATGIKHIKGQPENMAYITLFFDTNFIAHIHVNWLAPVKVRRTLVGGSRRMIVYDDLEPSEKIKVYDKGVNLITDTASVYEMLVSYRVGDMWAPQLDGTEALFLEVKHFRRCIEDGEKPITGGESGLQVVRIMEAASQSLNERGRPVELAPAVAVG